MKYALFLGCHVQARLKDYEQALRAVFREIPAVELVDVSSFNCCGYPIRGANQKAYLLLSSRNLALAQRHRLDLMVLCKCCFGSLKKAQTVLKNDETTRRWVNRALAKEGLTYNGEVEVSHALSVLYHKGGMAYLKSGLKKPLAGLKIATHYGCQLLRPSEVTAFDNPESPSLFDKLVEATGAESIDWPNQLLCCGAPVWGVNDALSMGITEKKLKSAREAGADLICTACPWCQLQFGVVQTKIAHFQGKDAFLPTLSYFQLLGLGFGFKPEALGLQPCQAGLFSKVRVTV
jgi:heterodisulfide reductase subunit B